jgi:hypothetical protein
MAGEASASTCLCAESILHSPQTFTQQLTNDVSKPWDANPISTQLSYRNWFSAPFIIFRTLTSAWDVHVLYLPLTVVTNLRAAAKGWRYLACDYIKQHELKLTRKHEHILTVAGTASTFISSNDAVQALMFTLFNDLHDAPLVPSSPQMFTITAGPCLDA